MSVVRNQILAVVRLELRRQLLSIRVAPALLLAGLPVLLFSAVVLSKIAFGKMGQTAFPTAAREFAAVFQIFTIPGVIYLGSVWVFLNQFRGEVLDRSLHYYFLTPIRRPVLVVGKYLSGFVISAILFGTSTMVSFLLAHVPIGFNGFSDNVLRGPGLGHMISYVGVCLLACAGYGALFLLIGLILRNPVVPAVMIFLWEAINFLLPPILKKVSVIFYIKSLLPVEVAEGPFQILADPVSVWWSAPGMTLFVAAALFGASFLIRRMEIAYGDD